MEIKKDLLEKIAGAQSPEQLTALIKESGLDIPEKDIEKLFTELSKSKESGEISDEELDKVAGGLPTGYRVMPIIFALKKIGILFDLAEEAEPKTQIGDLGLSQKHKDFGIL